MAGPERTRAGLVAKFKGGKYISAEREAEHGGRGLWAGSYVEPWLYRACIRRAENNENDNYLYAIDT
jgi:hypothetical protein